MMKPITICASALALLCFILAPVRGYCQDDKGGGATATAQDVSDILKQAKAKAHDEKYDEAEQLYKKAIELDPGSSLAQNGLGLVYFWQDKYELAAACFKKATDLDPKSAALWANYADALRQQDKLDEAIAALKKAIDIEPGDATSWNMLGEVYEWQNKPREATEAFDRAYKLSPRDRAVWENHVRRIRLNGDAKTAESLLRAEIKKDEKDSWSHNQLGLILFERKSYALAEVEFSRAAKLAPKNSSYLGNEGDSLRALGNYTQAISTLKKAIELDSENGRLYNLLGIAYQESKNLKMAEENYHRAVDLDDKNADYHANWAGALLDLGKKNEATIQAKRAIELGCKDHWVFAKLGLTP